MKTPGLVKRFMELVPPPRPAEWEIEESLAHLTGLAGSRQKIILQQVPAIWPVSNSLCFSYLSYAANAISCLDDLQVKEWVAAILDTYEKKGLKKAQNFMTDVEGNYLCHLRGENGVELKKVSRRLKTYGQSLAERQIFLESGPSFYTDTEKIFLPPKIAEFPDENDNFLYYKLILTAQLTLIKGNTYGLELESNSPFGQALHEGYNKDQTKEIILLADFINLFPDPRLAEDIFTMAEGQRINAYLATNFSGLWRDTEHIRTILAERRSHPGDIQPCTLILDNLAELAMTGKTLDLLAKRKDVYHWITDHFRQPAFCALDSALKTAAIYGLLNLLPQGYDPVPPLPWLGRLHPEEAQQVLSRKRKEAEEEFINALAVVLPELSRSTEQQQKTERPTNSTTTQATDSATALIMKPASDNNDQKCIDYEETVNNPRYLTIDNQQLEMPVALTKLAAEIRSDLGNIPDEYISAAKGMAGRAIPTMEATSVPKGKSLAGQVTYDEWDYRRKGFRKNWCLLNEKKVPSVKGTFVAATLDKYRGLLIKLKKQFEILRSDDRFAKRQKDGDDIDLDAVIESRSDIRAGLPGSENLFIRLQREERDIAVMFLIDMSSSTEGWVGDALKESLILMGESLESLGDRYAIAGFSGMRRTRVDFYHIKDFSEPYNDEIKGRIAAISPKEYTRMGPPLRHAAKILNEVDARVRLLIVLSDGKPEDYDDYKGEYAIEDTRHALIEAKTKGIHSFCITIDKKSHDYISHMYGDVNYIFLDDVKKLPVRMPDIYRNITS